MDQVNLLETKIRHEYDDLTECEYLLHAVFMHKGKQTSTGDKQELIQPSFCR